MSGDTTIHSGSLNCSADHLADHPADPSVLASVNSILEQFTHFGVELGLERIERLLAKLGNPQQQVPILHVAGSNGKGSTCAYLSAVLQEAGYRVGRYTSPHLVSWCERITLNGDDIAPSDLLQLLHQVQAAIQPDRPSPTQFEVITAAAWLYFAQQQVDVAVVEVGLGGRLDATNVCDRPLVSIITSLSREHWQRLGPTLAHISAEKAGILKPQCPAVIAPQPAEAAEVIQQRLQQLNCPAVWITPAIARGNGWAEWADRPNAKPLRYPLPLPGAHQLINSAVAIAALQQLRQQGWSITDEQIIRGMGKTRWPGRLQWITWQNQPLLIDGAHNGAGAVMLRRYIDESDRVTSPIRWVMGMIGNKDHAEVFRALLRPGDRLYLVPVPEHLPVDLNTLAAIAQEVCPDLGDCCIEADVIAGLHRALESGETRGTDEGAIAQPSTTVLCGSLYLIGHFFQVSQSVYT